MGVTITGMAEWERSIRKVVGTQWRMEQTMTFSVTDLGVEEDLARLPGLLKKYLEQFIQKYFLSTTGLLNKAFHQNATEEYWPQYLSQKPGSLGEKGVVGQHQATTGSTGGRAKHRWTREVTNMGSGFTALWSAISENPVVFQEGNDLVAGIGHMDRIRALRLNEFMGTNGSLATTSRLNSLFDAVEFGTGVEENVGAGNVNYDGATKDANIPGAWWFRSPSNEGKQGALFLGQKGMHFLYDERRQQPKQEYADFFRRQFPKFVQDKLGRGIRVST